MTNTPKPPVELCPFCGAEPTVDHSGSTDFVWCPTDICILRLVAGKALLSSWNTQIRKLHGVCTPDISLIKKLEALLTIDSEGKCHGAYDAGVTDAIIEIKNHFADVSNMVQSEIPELVVHHEAKPGSKYPSASAVAASDIVDGGWVSKELFEMVCNERDALQEKLEGILERESSEL